MVKEKYLGITSILLERNATRKIGLWTQLGALAYCAVLTQVIFGLLSENKTSTSYSY